MRIPRIYQNTTLTVGQQIYLDEPAARHVVQVLRLKTGNQLILFNGKGGCYEAELINISRKQCQVKICQYHHQECESILKLTLGQCLIRADKMDFAVSKAVELGVTKIVPLISDFCSIKQQAKNLASRQKHLQQIIISSCEQCGRNQIPSLEQIQKLSDWLTQLNHNQELILAFDPVIGKTSKELLIISPPPTAVTVIIGPEGGFSEQERNILKQYNVTWVRFGPRILRAETASPAFLGLMQHLWGDA